jgi:hypothetical protein
MGCITHLQLIKLVAVAEDVGADKADGVCEVSIIGIEVVIGWGSNCGLAKPASSMERVKARHRQHTMTCLPLKVCDCNLVLKYCGRFSQTSKYGSEKEVLLTSPFNQLVFFHSLLICLNSLLCRNAIPLIGFCILGSSG